MSVEGGGEGRVEERRCIKEALRRERSCTVFVSTGSFSGGEAYLGRVQVRGIGSLGRLVLMPW